MASGSITVKSPTKTVATYIGWSSSSNGSAANSSSVSATVYFRKTNGYTTKGTFAGSLTINGSSKSISRYGTWAGSYIAIGSHSVTVPHNADGKKSITISTTYSNSGTDQAGTYTGSGTAVLDTIPRASSISSSASWNAGDDLTVSISRSASSFPHAVSVKVGSVEVASATGVATGITFSGSEFQRRVFTALNAQAAQTATITVTTYSGATSVGAKSVTGTVSAPAASTFTCAQQVNIGQTQRIDISGDEKLTHSLRYSFRGREGYLLGSAATGTADEQCDWNIDDSFYELITDAVEDTCLLTLTSWYKPPAVTVTAEDGTQNVTEYEPIQVRTPVEKQFTIRVTDSEPLFASFSHRDTNDVTRTLTGSDDIAVRGCSDIQVTIDGSQKAAGRNGASIVAYEMRIGSDSVSVQETVGESTVMELAAVNGDRIAVTAYDTRGLSTTVEHPLTLKAYETISIENVDVRRENGVDERVILTADVYIWDRSFGDKQNRIVSCAYSYAGRTADHDQPLNGATVIEPADFVRSGENGLYHLEKVILGDTENGFALANSYDIHVTAADMLGSTQASTAINSGYPGIYMRRMSEGDRGISYQVGVNCVPDSSAGSGLYISGDALNFNGRDIAGGVSIGSVMGWITDTPPEGWLLLDGSVISRTEYSALFDVLGTTFGAGDGETTFNLPDMRGRVAVGKSNDADFNALGKTGGEKTHALTTVEMPSHTHSVSGTAASGGAHTHLMGGIATRKAGTWNGCVASAGCSDTAWTSARSGGAHTHSVSGTAAAAGSGGAHNNMQPYMVLNYIIKAC